MYMCVYICIYIYVYIYMCVYTYAYNICTLIYVPLSEDALMRACTAEERPSVIPEPRILPVAETSKSVPGLGFRDPKPKHKIKEMTKFRLNYPQTETLNVAKKYPN